MIFHIPEANYIANGLTFCVHHIILFGQLYYNSDGLLSSEGRGLSAILLTL